MHSESKTGAARNYHQLLDWNNGGKVLGVSKKGIPFPAPEKIECRRILHLSGRSDLSGGPISMLRLIEGLDADLFSHKVICPQDSEGVVPDLQKLSNVEVESMDLRRLDPRLLLKLRKLLNKKPVDLIHCHGKAAGLYGRPLGRWSKIPVLHQHHGLHYRHYPPVFRSFYLLLERMLSHWSENVVCVSESECAEAEALKLFSPGKGVVIHNGVDGERFHPDPKHRKELRRDWGIPRQAFVLLAITRANVQKHLELTLEVHRHVRQLRPDCVLILAGVSPEELQEILRKKIPCDSSHVICAPPEHCMERLINIADCYLSTSRWEGFSVGLLEALAMELPAVISRVTGNLYLAGLESEGVHLVPQGDSEAYVRKIEQLCSMEISGRSARATVLECYSQQRISRLIRELYHKVINSKIGVQRSLQEP